MSQQSYGSVARTGAVDIPIYTQAQESDQNDRESEDEEMTELDKDDDGGDSATVISISSSDNEDTNSPEPSPVPSNNRSRLPPIKHLFDKLNLKMPFPPSPSPQPATSQQASSSNAPVRNFHETPDRDQRATYPNAASTEVSRTPPFSVIRPGDASDALGPLNRVLLGFQDKSDRVIFYEVLELYRAELFAPIARKIGLTSDAVLRMAVTLGRDTIYRIAAQTSRPDCGYSAADFAPESAPLGGSPSIDSWRFFELCCLTAAYERTPYSSATTEMCSTIGQRFPRLRNTKSLKDKVKALRKDPLIVTADYARVAHEACAHRTEAGIAVARRKGINNENGWPYLDDILFDRYLLQRYGWKGHCPMERWNPLHINQKHDIQSLMTAINDYVSGRGHLSSQHAWRQISFVLYEHSGPFLFPVLKRYALRPPPCQQYRDHENSHEHLEFRRCMIDWIGETLHA